MKNSSSLCKISLGSQINWEIGTPELPRQIRRRLGKVKKGLEGIDWQTEDGFKEAKELWTGKVKDFTQAEIEKHPKYDNAMKWVHSLEERGILPSSS